MKITICEGSGFCFGVKRAVAAVESARNKYCRTGVSVSTFGPIVHNSSVVENLRQGGIGVITDLPQAQGNCLIIRSHGVSPDIMEKARILACEVVDATCPFVKKIHRIVTALKDEGLPIIVVGKKEHPEVQAIMGYAGEICFVVDSLEDVKDIPELDRAGIVVQTTKTLKEFNELSQAISSRISDCRIYNTICFETIRRQEFVAGLAAKSEVMIISGARHSSNTSKLFSISSSLCPKTYLVEKSSELESGWFDGVYSVGLACGASTPIDELERIRDAILSYSVGTKQ